MLFCSKLTEPNPNLPRCIIKLQIFAGRHVVGHPKDKKETNNNRRQKGEDNNFAQTEDQPLILKEVKKSKRKINLGRVR